MTLSMTFLFGTIINQGSSVIKIHSAPAWGSQFLQTFSSYLNHEPPLQGQNFLLSIATVASPYRAMLH